MNSKIWVLVGAMLLVSAPANASPPAAAPAPAAATAPDPGSLALAQQILAIAFPPGKRFEMYASVMDSIVGQARKSMQSHMGSDDKDFEAMVDQSTQRMYDELKANVDASIPDYFESFAHAYAREFSRKDLEAILAFVKTPTGQHYFARAPELLSDPDVQAANKRMMDRLLAKLPEIQRQTMQDVEDYIAKKKDQRPTSSKTAS